MPYSEIHRDCNHNLKGLHLLISQRTNILLMIVWDNWIFFTRKHTDGPLLLSYGQRMTYDSATKVPNY